MKVVLEWDGPHWLASVPDVPGCHTYGTNLPQTLRRVRQALGFFRRDAGAIALQPDTVLPRDMQASLDSVHQARLAAAAAQASLRDAALALTDGGLSRRDAATLLGISHQRVHQLLHER